MDGTGPGELVILLERLPIPQALKLVADLEEALTNHPAGADSLHLTWLGRLEEENP